MSFIRREFLKNEGKIEVLNKNALSKCVVLNPNEEVMIFGPSEYDEETYLNFYIPLTDDLFDAFDFGINFDENNDWINAYVNWYPKSNKIEMTFQYNCARHPSEDFEFDVSLTNAEKETILKAIQKSVQDIYCMNLKEFFEKKFID